MQHSRRKGTCSNDQRRTQKPVGMTLCQFDSSTEPTLSGIYAQGHDQLIPTHYPKIIGLLVKLSMSQPIVEPNPGFVQPPPPKVPYKEARYRISS